MSLRVDGQERVPVPGGDPPDDGDRLEALEALAGTDVPDLATTNGQALQARRYPDLDAFLASPEPEYVWLVPDVIERGDRVVFTGPEGGGKSTLLRQIAVQTASGVHPFTLAAIDPLHVLLIDLENSLRQTRRALWPLRNLAGDQYGSECLTVAVDPHLRPDLYRDEDREHLAAIVAAHPCDLLVLGPVYKLAGGDPTTEEHAKVVTSLLDELRAAHDVAVLLEHHPPHQQPGRATRTLRPYGASLWLRWPEFGLHLADGGVLSHWRGQRDERDWPTALTRGGHGRWPWVRSTTPADVQWGAVLSFVATCDEQPSYQQVADAIGVHKSTVGRVVNAHRADWDALWDEGYR